MKELKAVRKACGKGMQNKTIILSIRRSHRHRNNNNAQGSTHTRTQATHSNYTTLTQFTQISILLYSPCGRDGFLDLPCSFCLDINGNDDEKQNRHVSNLQLSLLAQHVIIE